jgi:GT2 family glycosyltransferase
MKFSIIIPVKRINDYLRQSILKILSLDWPDFEVIIVPDKFDKKNNWPKTRVIVSGDVGPAEKRDLASKYAEGEILAFLDDDAYPQKNWLKKAACDFDNKNMAAVGGPAITPVNSSVFQKISGAVFESYLGAGAAQNRHLSIGGIKEVDDWPTVNFLVRKNIFLKIGGFDTSFWPGEDTKFCLDLTTAGYKIIYDPKVIVYHHRKKNLSDHLKQIGNYGLHRGYFAKKYPQTSLKLWYFIPSFFTLYLISLFLLLLLKYPLIMIYILPLKLYFIGLIIDGLVATLRYRNLIVGTVLIPMIFFTHIWYGIQFIRGLLLTKLTR